MKKLYSYYHPMIEKRFYLRVFSKDQFAKLLAKKLKKEYPNQVIFIKLEDVREEKEEE